MEPLVDAAEHLGHATPPDRGADEIAAGEPPRRNGSAIDLLGLGIGHVPPSSVTPRSPAGGPLGPVVPLRAEAAHRSRDLYPF